MKYKQLFEPKIHDLEFDPLNPRLPKKLQHKSDSEVIEWMLTDASLLDLVASIGINGFFPGEPLLVTKNKKGTYTVIEGNRRLAACKILNNPTLGGLKQKTVNNILDEIDKKNIPSVVPAFLFEKREDILEYLGFRHVTGVKSWGALAKAKYLSELLLLDNSKDKLFLKCRRLAKKIGSKADYVLRLLISFQLFEIIEKDKFFNIKNLSEESIEFSNLIDAATRYSNISTFLSIDFNSENPLENLNKENFIKLTKWLFERDDENKTKVGENRNIRILNSIISSPKALAAFESNVSLSEAYLLTEGPDKIFENSLNHAKTNLQNAKDVISKIAQKTKKLNIDLIETIVSLSEEIEKSISK